MPIEQYYFKEVLREADVYDILDRDLIRKVETSNFVLNDKKIQWHRHVKKAASLRFKLYKNFNKQKYKLFSANDSFTTAWKADNFLFKYQNAALLFFKPLDSYNFFDNNMSRMTKVLNPRTIRNFSERVYLDIRK